MKVKDLINKLEKADPEQEVFVAPLIFIPILQIDGNAGNFSDDDFQRTAAPFESYPIEHVGLTTDLCECPDKGKQYVWLGYTTNEQSILCQLRNLLIDKFSAPNQPLSCSNNKSTVFGFFKL